MKAVAEIPDAAPSGARGAFDDLLNVSGLYETILIFSLLMVAEWLIPGSSNLASIAPHPFWVPVVLLSVQYGSTTGLMVALVATIASWLSGWPPQAEQEDFYAYSMRICREPVLWTFCALVVGGLRNRQIKTKAASERRLSETEAQRDRIASYCTELQNHVASCERAVAAGEMRSTDFALDILQALRESEQDEIESALRRAVEAWLGQATYTLYVSPTERPNGPGVARAEGGAHPFRLPNASVAAAMQVAITAGRTLTVVDGADARLLEGIGVLASPIRPSIGLLVIEFVPIERLVPATTFALEAIAEALAETWTRHCNVEVVGCDNVAGPAQENYFGLHMPLFAAPLDNNLRITAGRSS